MNYSIIKDIKNTLSKADIALIIVVILISTTSLFCLGLSKKPNTIIVHLDNKDFNEYDLNKDQIIVINNHNTVEISDKKVRMLYSDCKNQQCVKQGWSEKVPIICVPNKLSIKFSTKESTINQEMLITY